MEAKKVLLNISQVQTIVFFAEKANRRNGKGFKRRA